MKTCQRISLAVAVVMAQVATSSTSFAAWITLQLPYVDYGHVYNTDNGLVSGIPVPWCAPTATANSFRFLENHYPAIYNNSLSGGNVIGMRNSLANGWLSPGGLQRPGMIINAQGSSDQSWWENKVWYIEDFAPNTTIFGGMIESDPSTWYRGGDLIRGSPTWHFLWGEVEHGEDIEIKIDTGTSVAHALTLTSIAFDDLNGNLLWDFGEERKIDYLDPNNPSQLFWGTVQQNLAGNRMQFWWNNGGANPAQWVTIEGAYTESVPEPAALSLLVFAAAALIFFRRRQA